MYAEGKKELSENRAHDIILAKGVIILVHLMTKPMSKCCVEHHTTEADIHFVQNGLDRISYTSLLGLELEEHDSEGESSFWHGEFEQVTLKSRFYDRFPSKIHTCYSLTEIILISY